MDELEFPEKQSNTKLWLTMVGIVLLTGLAAWLVPLSQKPEFEDIPPPSGAPGVEAAKPEQAAAAQPQHPEATAAQQQQVAPAAAEQALPQVKAGAEGDLARTLVAEYEAGRVGLDQLYARARELDKQKAFADAWLLDFYAARKGQAQSALTLARSADPLQFKPGQSVLEAPDVVQAHKWYLAAAKYGDKEAPVMLARLKDHVRSQAEAGDPLAANLLLQW